MGGLWSVVGDARCIELEDVENALDEMLFSGGSLNLKLLGAEAGREPPCQA